MPLPRRPRRPAAQQWTVLDVIRWTAARFGERGLATPRLDAELIVAHVLGLPRIQLYVQSDRPLLATELADIRGLIQRRQAGESVAYLVGKKEFWGLELAVDARVLVPRPDTETLIEEARVRLEGDLAAPFEPHAPFRLMVANLPYIPSADLAALPPEVRAEPALALDGGAD